MDYKKLNKKYHSIILILMVLAISVGYAILNSNIQINGISKIKNASWDIHFENIVVNSNSVELPNDQVNTPATIDFNDNTRVYFHVTLKNPGDFYEFTVDAVNSGSMDAMVDTVVSKLNNQVIENLPSYLIYTTTLENGDPIKPNHLLLANRSEKYKIRVEFDKEVEEEDLPSENQTLNFDFTVNFKQRDESGIELVSYQVLHRYQNLDLTTYSEVVENLKGEGGTSVTPSVSNRNGFNSPNTQTVEINADGSTIVTYVYTRKTYSFSITDRTYIDNTSTSDGDYPYETEIKVKAIERNHYTFKWSDEDTNLERIITLTEDLELTPIYTKDQDANFTVVYHANGGEGSMDNQTIDADTPTNLVKNTFTKEGYKFKYWNSESDNSGTIYYDEQSVENIGDITLYAIWKEDTFQTVFEQRGACIFNGTSGNITGEECSDYQNQKYIDTGIKLYSAENVNKDYEIGFTVDRYDVSEQTDSQVTIMNSLQETKPYPGIVYRRNGNNLELVVTKDSSGGSDTRSYTASSIQNVKIYRINGSIYFSINNGEKKLINSFNPTFDLNVWFGAAPTSGTNLTPRRFFNGTLSNMYIKLGNYVEAGEYLITLNPNGGSVNPSSVKVTDGNSIGELPTPTRYLYEFTGWYTGLTNGVKVESNFIPEDDMELYAHWEKKETYSITFEENGGSNVDDFEIERGDSIGFLPTSTKSGKVLDGWYLEGNLTTKINKSYVPTKDTILYAKWIETTFPKVFEQEGACVFNGANANITGEECSDYHNQKYIDTGISLFSSENVDKDYEIGFEIVSYDPSQNIDRATIVNAKVETSPWDGIVFRREFTTTKFQLEATKTSGGDVKTSIESANVSNVKIYRIGGEIYYSINDGEKVKFYDTFEYNPTFDLTTWFGAGPTSGTDLTPRRYFVGTLSNMYIRLGIYEETGKYTITLNPNGGSVNPTSKKINQGEVIGTLPIPTKNNQIFIGWYTGIEVGEEVTSSYVPNGNIEIFARYRNLEQYTITFDKNHDSATGSMSNQTIYENTETQLNENEYALVEYQFVGWNTERDGSGTSYLDEESITLTDNITLYAQWIKTYTLTFDKNHEDATGDSYSITVASGVSTPIPDEAFSAYTLTGKTIDSYNTLANNNGTSYYKGQSIAITTDTTLYVNWKAGGAILATGQAFNQAIKRASGSTSATYSTTNTNITNFTKYTGTVTQELLNNATIVSSDDSDVDIYAWFDNGTIYYYTESSDVYLNSDCSNMFYNLNSLEELDFSEFDLSKVTTTSSMLSNMNSLNTIVTPKVNSTTSITLPKTYMNSSNNTYTSITSSTITELTLKVPYTITFDSSDGERNASTCTQTGSITTKQIYPGNPLGTLPTITAIKTNYTPDGWTDEDETHTITAETIPTGDTTYYVKWIKQGNWVGSKEVSFDDSNSLTNCSDVQCVINYIADNLKERRVSVSGS